MGVAILAAGMAIGVIGTAMIYTAIIRINEERDAQARWWRQEKERKRRLEQRMKEPTEAMKKLQKAIEQEAERGLGQRGRESEHRHGT